ncbi:hemagglutinin repeat-containing protein [Pseudomonas sp. EL_65y_Pfl1_R32]|uniref:hemagglutinin repeat-containing protein n=1 Tax=Pseudomonas sp. EL_65y_Pfl1_R32 TaxID=3088696 RepID=UPI0030DDC144
MDVRQFAFLVRQPSAAVKTRSSFLGLPKRGLALVLANAMFWQPLLAQADGIVVSAPGTSLGQAGNGVPIVNIAAPNGSGLSHNQFSDYNVGQQGVILNNATSRTQSTQLGGIILGNPNLKGNAANVILNEVNGGSPSQLRGFTEVAGQSAHVIVANPYGITCNGCGFINTPQATLTTGKAVIENGQVSRYQIDQGSVSIEGAGLNANNIDSFEIIARSARINAEIQAKNLAIIAGTNDVDAKTLKATARASDAASKPQLAIDSSALGGMYAGAIKLVSSEAGVGVKLDGKMAASAGDIQIDANGDLTVAQVAADGAVNLKAANLEAKGPVYAGTTLEVKTQGDLTSQNNLVAKDRITLTSGGLLTNNGIIEGGVKADNTRNTEADVSITAQNLTNAGKTIIASRDLSVSTTQTLNNQGGTLSGQRQTTVTASTLDNQNKGRVLSAAKLKLTADTAVNGQGGLINSASQLTATLGHLNNNDGEVSSQADATLILGTMDNLTGVVMAENTLTLTATGALNNQNGLLSGWQGLTVNGSSLDNRNSGTVSSRDGDVGVTLSGALLNSHSGAVVSQKALSVIADSVDNSDKGALSSVAGQRLTVKGLLDNTHAGSINSGAELTLLTGTLDNSHQGTIGADDTSLVSASDAVDNSADGLIASRTADLQLNAASLGNAKGSLQGKGAVNLTVTGDVDNQSGNVIAQEGDLNVTAANLDSRGGTLSSVKGALETHIVGVLKNGYDLNNNSQAGTVQAQRLMLKALGGIDNNGGRIAAQSGDAVLNAGTLGNIDNRNGRLYASNLVQITGNDLDNSGELGGNIAGGQIAFDLSGKLNNRKGIIESAGTLSTTAASLDNQNGQVRALGKSLKTVFAIGGLLDNTNGTLETANTDLGLDVGSFRNQGGEVLHVGTGIFGISMANLNDVGGQFVTHGDLTLDGDNWTNSSSLQANYLTVNVRHLTQTASGQLLSTAGLEGSGIDWSNDGQIGTDGALDVDLSGNYTGKGRMSSAAALDLHAALINLDKTASIAGGGPSTVNVDGVLTNYGRLTSAADMTVSAAGINNYGTLGSAQKLTATTGALLNDHGLIFSGGDMGLRVDSLSNRYASIYSLGNLSIDRDGLGALATGIVNSSGSIQSDGSMSLAASTIQNVRAVLTTNNQGIYTASIGEIQCIEGYNAGDCSGKRNHVWQIVQRDKFEVTEASAASSITAGSTLAIRGGDLLNSSSSIASGGAFSAIMTNLFNNGIETGETETSRTFLSERTDDAGGLYDYAASFNNSYSINGASYNPKNLGGLVGSMSGFIGQTESELSQFRSSRKIASSDQSYAAIIQAGGAVSVDTRNGINSSVVRPGYTYVGAGPRTDTQAPANTFSTRITVNQQLPPDLAQQQVNPVSLPGFSLPVGENGLFRLSGQSSSPHQPAVRVPGLPDTSGRSSPQKYLIETNPVLTDLKQFMSSDYLLSNLGYDPDQSAKRLGDGFYEQKLIQQAVIARTGQRFIDGQTSDEGMFKYLMNNAVASKQELNLQLGVSLTSEQVAALTHDIVWMENATVNGAEVLVPVLYMANANNRLAANGALIQGSDVTLIAGKDLNNAGTLRASNNLNTTAGNDLVNSGLLEAKNRLEALAGNNLTNKAGGIIAGRDVSVTAARDVINERTVTTHESSSSYRTERTDFVDNTARIEAANGLTVKAGQDFNNTGGVLKSGADTTISAGRDVNLVSVEKVTSGVRGSHTNQAITQYGSTVDAGQDLKVSAGRDLTAIASQIEAKRDVSMSAVGDLTLASAADEQHSYGKTKKVTSQEDHVQQVSTTLVAGRDVALSSGQDLVLTASRVSAGNEAYLFAGTDLVLNTAQNSDYSYYSKTKKGAWGKKSTKMSESDSGIAVSSTIDAGKKVVISATQDINAEGAKINSGGALLATAGHDINLVAAENYASQTNASSKKGLFSSKSSSSSNSQTTLNSTELVAKSIDLRADNDISLEAAALRAEGVVKLNAGNDVEIGTAQVRQASSQSKQSSKVGVSLTVGMSASQKGQHAQQSASQSIGSDISADSLQITSGRDTTVRGSTLVTDRDLQINAGRNLEVVSAENTDSATSASNSKKLGEVGSWWQSATGIVKTKKTDQSETTRQSGSQIASLGGDVSLTAGEHFNQIASQVVAPKGDIDIKAKYVDIQAGFDTLKSNNTASTSRTAVGGTVSVPMVDALRSLQGTVQSAQQTSDGRMLALSAVNAAMSAKTALDSGQALMNSNLTGVKISVNLSDSRSHNESNQSGSNVVGSSVIAGGDVNIIAKGAGADSHLNVVGSRIEAGGDANLKADGKINLLAAQNTAHQDSSNNNSGWSAGIGFSVGGQQNGFTLDLAANKGRGMSDGDDVTQTNTSVKAGQTVRLDSGGDTNLKGAIVTGQQVKAKVGGDLNIESLQDASTYRSEQLSANVGVSICIPPFCAGMSSVSGGIGQQKMQSDYASVSEQSGIKARDGGFQIEVKGNTDLKGAIINSTDKAVADGKNTLTTGSLTSSDIKNKADYDATSINLSGGYSGGGKVGRDANGNVDATKTGTPVADKGGFGVNAPVALYAGDSSSSKTLSGISGAAVNITDSAKQQGLTGQTAEQAVAAINTDVSSDRDGSNKLKPIFDAKEIQVGFEITGKFVQNVAMYLESRAREADSLRSEAEKEYAKSHDPKFDPDSQAEHRQRYLELNKQANAVAADWGAGGTYRQIATALVAGASGNVAGGSAQFAQNMVVNYVQQQGSDYIGKLVINGLKEGSPEHAGLHAILGCAGAAASNQSCSAGALGGSASSLLAGLFNETSPNETSEEREAKRNIIASMVTGIAAMSNPNGAATATNAAIANVDNNWLATQQIVQMVKEVAEAKTFTEKMKVTGKWLSISGSQDMATASALFNSFKDGMAGAGLDTLNGTVGALRDPVASIDAMNEFILSVDGQKLFGAAAAGFKSQITQLRDALLVGGDENAEKLGKQYGEAVALYAQVIATGGTGGAAQGASMLAKAGIEVSINGFKKIAATTKAAGGVEAKLAKLERVGPDPDLPNPVLVGGSKYVESATVQANTTVKLSESVRLANGKVIPKDSIVTVSDDTMKVVYPDGTSELASYSKANMPPLLLVDGPKATTNAPNTPRFITDSAGNTIDLGYTKGLRETNVTVTGTRGGVQYPLQGQTPDSYANLGNGHVVVYGPEGRALYDVSSSRIKVVEWNQAPNGTYFPKKGSDTKVFEGNVPQSVLDSLGLK